MRSRLRLRLYVARRVAAAVVASFAGFAAVIAVANAVEALRRTSGVAAAGAGAVAAMSLLRAPEVVEEVAPFAMAAAAIGAYLSLARRGELVAARAAGASAWTLALPGVVVAASTGVLLAAAFDPLAAWSNRTENAIESRLFAAEAAPTDGRTFWLRQAKPDAIVRARYARPSEAALYGASFFLFAPDGGLERRIDASIATLRKGAWSLADATTYRAGEPPAKAAHLDLPTEIDPVALVQGVAEPRLVSFWGLPAASAAAGAAGLDPRPYLARFAGLAATPLALVAVTLLAAMNSMTISRGGFPAWRLAHGVLATFVLYVALKVGADFARSGFIGAAYAASVPSAVGCLAGVQGLLRREDG